MYAIIGIVILLVLVFGGFVISGWARCCTRCPMK